MEEIKTFRDLFKFLQIYNGKIIDWLNIDSWKGKDKQESLLRLLMGLNLVSKLDEFQICKGNFNNKTIYPINNMRQLFCDNNNKYIKLKDKGDSSDLTCINIKNENHLLLTTSKNLKKYTINDLDIEKIITNFKQYEDDNYIMTLCICIRDKHIFEKMLKNTEKSNHILKDLIINRCIIIDWNDLEEAYNIFKNNYLNINFKLIINKKDLKNNIIFKMHQEYSIYKTIQFKNNNIKNILWGHIQRSGKSYIIAGTIIEDIKQNNKNKNCNNYLIITTAPNETISQYIKVLSCEQLKNVNLIYLNGYNDKPK